MADALPSSRTTLVVTLLEAWPGALPRSPKPVVLDTDGRFLADHNPLTLVIQLHALKDAVNLSPQEQDWLHNYGQLASESEPVHHTL